MFDISFLIEKEGKKVKMWAIALYFWVFNIIKSHNILTPLNLLWNLLWEVMTFYH